MGLVVQMPMRDRGKDARPPAAEQRTRRAARWDTLARRRLERIYKSLGSPVQVSDPGYISLDARPVLEAAVELVYLCGDGTEYRLDPIDDKAWGVAGKVTRHLRYFGGEAEIQRHLDMLVRRGLLAAAGGGVLRIGDR